MRGVRTLFTLILLVVALGLSAQKYSIVSGPSVPGWKSTNRFSPGWFNINYTPTGWVAPGAIPAPPPPFPPPAPPTPGTQYMWFQSPYSDTAYFRYEFELKSECAAKASFDGTNWAKYKVDNEIDLYINGALVHTGANTVNGLFDINPFLRLGKNVIAMRVFNTKCSGSYCPYYFCFGVNIDYTSGPEIQMDPDKSVCEGDSVYFGPTDHYQSYLWSTGETTRSIKTGKEGTYVLTATDTAGCTWVDTVRLETYKHNKVEIGPKQTICTGEEAIFRAGGGYDSYLWSTGDTTDTIGVTYNGIFWVSVTDANGCTSSDTSEVEVFDHASVDLAEDTVLCKGETMMLTVQSIPFSTYLWDDGSTDTFRLITEAGNYSVTITNHCGSVSDDMNAEYINDISVNIGEDDYMCKGQPYELKAEVYGATKYTWSTGDTNYRIVVERAGNYWVLVEDRCGNEGFDEMQLIENIDPEVLVPNSFTPNDDDLNETWKVHAFSYGEYELQVVDAWGNQVFYTNDVDEEWDGKNNGNPVETGIFMYKLTYVDCQFQTKIFTGVVHVVR